VGEHPDTSGDVISFRDSRTFYGASCVALAAMATMSSPWPWTVLFGAQSLWAFLRFINQRVRLRVTDDGIVDETFSWYSPGLIRWEGIRDVRAGRWGGIEIELKDPKAFYYRLSPPAALSRAISRLFGLGPAVINPSYYKASRRELLESLEAALDSYTLDTVRQSDTLGSGGAAA
jgi:hypothetical protein